MRNPSHGGTAERLRPGSPGSLRSPTHSGPVVNTAILWKLEIYAHDCNISEGDIQAKQHERRATTTSTSLMEQLNDIVSISLGKLLFSIHFTTI